MILVYSQHPGMGWITLRRCCHSLLAAGGTSLPQPQEGTPRGHLSQPHTRSRTIPAEPQHQPDGRAAAGHCWTPHSLPVSSHQLDTQPSSPPCGLVSSNMQPCQQLPCRNAVGNGAKVLPAHPPTALHGQATLQPLQEEVGPFQHSIFDKPASTIPSFLSCLSRVWKQTPGHPQ